MVAAGAAGLRSAACRAAMSTPGYTYHPKGAKGAWRQRVSVIGGRSAVLGAARERGEPQRGKAQPP